MKIQYKKILKPLIKLHFLKNQYYKYLKDSDWLNTITVQLKQSLKIIYLYDKKKKKILFLGFPFNKLIHNQVNHCFSSKINYLKTNLKKKKFDLIVFYKTSEKDLVLLETLQKRNIPVIIFGDSGEKGYNLNTLTRKKSIKNFNFFVIFSVLTKYLK